MKKGISFLVLLGLAGVFSVKAFAGVKEVSDALGQKDYALVIIEADKALTSDISTADKGTVIYCKAVANYNSGKDADNYQLLQNAKALNIPAGILSGIYWYGGLAKWKTPAEAVAIWTEGANLKGAGSQKEALIVNAINYTTGYLKKPAPQDLVKKLFVECPGAWREQKDLYSVMDWKKIDRKEQLAILQNIFEAIECRDADGKVIADAVTYKLKIGDKIETLKVLLK